MSLMPVLRAVPALLAVLALMAGMAVPATAEPTRADLESAQERLAALESELALALDRVGEATAQLQDLEAEATQARARADVLGARAAASRAAGTTVVAALYRGVGALGWSAVLSADGMTEATRRAGYLQMAQRAQDRTLERLVADRTALAADLEVLAEASAAAEATQSELAGMRADVQEMVAGQQTEVTQLAADIERIAAERAAREAAAARAERLAQQQQEAQAALAAAGTHVTQAGEAARPDAPAGGGQAPEAAAPPTPPPADDPPAPAAPPAPAPEPAPQPAPPAAAPASNPGAQAAVDAAMSQIGKPYQWGAEGPDAYDCSGLMLWAWRHGGVSLPHSSRAQYAATTRVPQDSWQPGDLLFAGNPIHHVGMYIGNGQMVHAPHSGTTVRVSSAYRSDYAGAGRP